MGLFGFMPDVLLAPPAIQSLCRYLLPLLRGGLSLLSPVPAGPPPCTDTQILHTDCTDTAEVQQLNCYTVALLHSSCAPPLQLQGQTFRVGAVGRPAASPYLMSLCFQRATKATDQETGKLGKD